MNDNELKNKRFNIKLPICDKRYVDKLIIALVRQGYSVYMNDENGTEEVNFSIYGDDLTEISYE